MKVETYNKTNNNELILRKIAILPTYYLFNAIRFHFHLCDTGISADLRIVHCL